MGTLVIGLRHGATGLVKMPNPRPPRVRATSKGSKCIQTGIALTGHAWLGVNERD